MNAPTSTPRSRFYRAWAVAVLVGLASEVVLHLLVHTWHFAPLVAFENWAFDGTMRLQAGFDRPAAPDARDLTLVDIDDATWRDPAWGGGEPQRAPRAALFNLVDAAFRYGAQQVVLDVLVEERTQVDRSAAQAAESNEDSEFVANLSKLLAKPWFGQDRQLILVRTIRKPLGAAEGPAGQENEQTTLRRRRLGELRSSPGLDALVRQSGGRIGLAAPYFLLDSDQTLRSWQLFKPACSVVGREGAEEVRFVPSVQLLVFLKNSGVGPERRDQLSRGPASVQAASACASGAKVDERTGVRQADVRALEDGYWQALRAAVCRNGSPQCKLAKYLPESENLADRVIFRYAPRRAGLLVNVLPASDLLTGRLPESALGSQLLDRVVIIAQSFEEAGDRHSTPLGELTGGWVLVNAIDSLAREQVVQRPSNGVLWTIVLVECSVVGWVFTVRHSLVAAILLAVGMTAVLIPVSYIGFKVGVWLDFAFPVLGIFLHRLLHGDGSTGHH